MVADVLHGSCLAASDSGAPHFMPIIWNAKPSSGWRWCGSFPLGFWKLSKQNMREFFNKVTKQWRFEFFLRFWGIWGFFKNPHNMSYFEGLGSEWPRSVWRIFEFHPLTSCPKFLELTPPSMDLNCELAKRASFTNDRHILSSILWNNCSQHAIQSIFFPRFPKS